MQINLENLDHKASDERNLQTWLTRRQLLKVFSTVSTSIRNVKKTEADQSNQSQPQCSKSFSHQLQQSYRDPKTP